MSASVSVPLRAVLNPVGDASSTRSGGWPDKRASVEAGTGKIGPPDAAWINHRIARGAGEGVHPTHKQATLLQALLCGTG